jgi:Protein of unknown function (DUF3617)
MRSVVLRAAATAAPLFLAVATAAGAAEPLLAGLWKVTSKPQANGIAGPEQVTTRCLTVEAVADLGKTFSPEHRTHNSTCERVEYEANATKMNWRLQCTGQISMEVAGAFDFDSARHYTAVVTTIASIGGRQMNSRVNIEGEWIGECQ